MHRVIMGLSGRSPAAILALWAALAVPAAAAQEGGPADLTNLSIEELLTVEVSAASKFAQKTSEAPAAVTVVTAADIKTYGYRSLADILRSVRGLYVSYDRQYQYVGVRGFNRPGDYNGRLLLLVDGYRVNDALYDSASIGGEFFLDVDLIERVEVVRGPGSSLYGGNAFFGVANVITRRGRDYGGAEAAAEIASFGTGKGRLTYGRQFDNGAELMLSATYLDSKGQDLYFPEFANAANNNGLAQGRDRENAKRFYGKLAFGGLTLTAAHSERVKGIPTASYGSVFNDPRTQATDSQSLLDLAYYGSLREDLDLTARLYYGGYFYHGVYPWDQPPVTINKDDGVGEWWGAEGRLTGRFGSHRLVAGLEYQSNFRQEQRNHDVDPYLLYLDERHRSQRRGWYVQDEVSLRQGLLLNAGLRYDHYSTAGGTLNPRLGLIVKPQEATALKLLYGTAFRPPNAYELYYASASLGSKPPQDLRPEEISSYEFVVEHQVGPNFRLTGTVYQNEIRHLIDQVLDTDGLTVFRNLGQVKTRGAEFEAERAWDDDTRLRASYAWQLTRDQSNGAELVNSPRHLAKLNYSRPLFGDGARAGIELQYTSRRRTLADNAAAGYLLANATLLSRHLAKDLEVSASVYNLFGKRYFDPGRPEQVEDPIPQDGRSFRLKLTYKF